jgi:predicted N-acyltransferase
VGAQVIESLEGVPAAEWNSLAGVAAYPFLRHEFLRALEVSGCVGPATQPDTSRARRNSWRRKG